MTEFQPMPEQPPTNRFTAARLHWEHMEGENWRLCVQPFGRQWFAAAGNLDGSDIVITAPVTIGERRAVREEWAQSLYRFSDGKQSRSLAYRSDGVVGCVSADGTFVFHGYLQDWHRDGYRCFSQSLFSDWQPADTMPDWAVRRYQRCVSCVPIQACNVTEEQAAAMACYDPASGMTAVDCFLSDLAGKWPNIDECVDSRWGWLITWEDDDAT